MGYPISTHALGIFSSHLTSLTLSVDSEYLDDSLGRLVRLTQLHLEGNNGNITCGSISLLTDLISLKLSNDQSDIYRAFVYLSKLRSLYVRRGTTTNEAVSNLTQLTHLHLSGWQFNDNAISTLTGLTDLEFAYTNITDGGVSRLTNLEKLRVIASDIVRLRDLPKLKTLHIRSPEASPFTANAAIGILTQLRELALLGDGLYSDEAIIQLIGLTRLLLGGPYFTNDGISNLTNLEILDLHNTHINVFHTLPKLSRLSIFDKDERISNESISATTQLKELVLICGAFDDRAISSLTNLTSLNIERCPITAQGVSVLTNLQDLYIDSVRFTKSNKPNLPMLRRFRDATSPSR